MIKSMTVLEVVKGDRNYKLIMESDSPLGECFDVLCEMRGQVLEVINSHALKESQPEIKPVPDEPAASI